MLDITHIIAQIFGIILTIFGFSIIVNKTSVIASLGKTVESKATLWVLGFITLVMGTIMVVLHNIWTSGVQLFITILGWLTLIKGITILVFPELSAGWYRKVMSHDLIVASGFISFIIGLILIRVGIFG